MDYVFHTNDLYLTTWEIPLHQHSCSEISYLFEGELETTVNNSTYRLRRNQMIFFPPCTPHVSRGINGPYKMIFILSSQYPKYIPACVPISDLEGNPLQSLFRQILSEYRQVPPRGIDIFFKWLDVLSAYCKQFIKSENTDLMNEMYRILLSNITNPDFILKSDMLVKGYSADYLRTVFKKQSGTTPKEYLVNRRIDYARGLMTATDGQTMQIKDIAISSGFRDPLYFSRVFRNRTHMTPSEYMAQASGHANCANAYVSFDYIPIYSNGVPELLPELSQRYSYIEDSSEV